MGRTTRDNGVRNQVVEDAGMMLGDARDFLERFQSRLGDVLQDLEDGKMTFIAARLALSLDFRAAHKDLDDWQARWASDAQEAGFPYIHPTLTLRIVAPLPKRLA
jgi:hypothetical protein